MVEKAFDEFHGDGKTQPFAKRNLHIGHAHDFACEIEERAAAVAGVDLGAGLQIEFAFELAGLGAQDALRDGALEPERTADGKDAVAHIQGVGVAEGDGLELGRVLVLDMEQGEVVEFVDGNNLDLLVGLAVELTVFLLINFDGNLGFTFDDVEVGDEIAVFIQEEAGAEAFGGLDLDDGFADLLDEGADIAGGGGLGGAGVKLTERGRHDGGGGGGGTGLDDAGDGAARDDEDGVAEVNDVGVGLFL